jgi:cell wall-associated NlpC family hydrolase
MADGCAPMPDTIKDISELKQNAFAYVDPGSADSLLAPADMQRALDARFDSLYFAAWRQGRVRVSKEDASWGFRQYSTRTMFGENKRKRPASWFETLERNADLNGYPNRRFAAITTANTDVRVLPTHRPLFFDFRLPGEGFPFDMLQQSRLAANTPVRVLHATADGEWLFVDTPAAAGWVSSAHVAAVDWAFMWQWITGTYVAVIEDGVPVLAAEGRFLFTAPFGAVFPLLRQDSLGWRILAAMPDERRNAKLEEAVLTGPSAAVKPVPLTWANLARSVNALLGQSYGWGGLYQDRDCSLVMKDLFSPFGIFLPRTSADQASSGAASLDLAGFPQREKEAAVCAAGIPFLSLVHLKGHIMLYLGCLNGHPVVFHNLWGIRTRSFWGREGRHVVGQAVITTLHPGRELRNADHDAEILRRADKLVFLLPPEPAEAAGNR